MNGESPDSPATEQPTVRAARAAASVARQQGSWSRRGCHRYTVPPRDGPDAGKRRIREEAKMASRDRRRARLLWDGYRHGREVLLGSPAGARGGRTPTRYQLMTGGGEPPARSSAGIGTRPVRPRAADTGADPLIAPPMIGRRPPGSPACWVPRFPHDRVPMTESWTSTHRGPWRTTSWSWAGSAMTAPRSTTSRAR